MNMINDMTLRDYFAINAMSALLTEPMWPNMVTYWSNQLPAPQKSGPDIVAHVSYMMADAMLRARESSND